jgi:arylsulfatase A-like enzyme
MNSEDLMPTLLSLVRVGIPQSVEGLDYSAHLRGGPDPSDSAALLTCVQPFGEFNAVNGGKEYRGLRTARHTYVRDLNGPWLLFDNETDPAQMHNLIGDPAAAELQARLDTQLTKRLKANGDEFLPGRAYVEKWGYHVDATGTVPYTK